MNKSYHRSQRRPTTDLRVPRSGIPRASIQVPAREWAMADPHVKALRLTQLQLIDALVRSGSLTEAAKQMGLTQPAASHSLARLRRDLHDPIFVRTSEGMQPTPYGMK